MRQKKRNPIAGRWIALFLALMFMLPLSSMTGSATGTGGDVLIVRGSASPSEAEPGQTITFSATAEFGNIIEDTIDDVQNEIFRVDIDNDGQLEYGNWNSVYNMVDDYMGNLYIA